MALSIEVLIRLVSPLAGRTCLPFGFMVRKLWYLERCLLVCTTAMLLTHVCQLAMCDVSRVQHALRARDHRSPKSWDELRQIVYAPHGYREACTLDIDQGTHETMLAVGVVTAVLWGGYFPSSIIRAMLFAWPVATYEACTNNGRACNGLLLVKWLFAVSALLGKGSETSPRRIDLVGTCTMAALLWAYVFPTMSPIPDSNLLEPLLQQLGKWVKYFDVHLKFFLLTVPMAWPA